MFTSVSPIALEAARLMLRASVGSFFAASGFRKLCNPEVRAKVESLFAKLHVPAPLGTCVRWGEFLGGLGVIVGCLTPLACGGLTLILLGAVALDVWRVDIAGKHPHGLADWLAKLWDVPETLLVVMLGVLALLGAGRFSIDAFLF